MRSKRSKRLFVPIASVLLIAPLAAQSIPDRPTLRGVALSDDQFVAVGDNGMILAQKPGYSPVGYPSRLGRVAWGFPHSLHAVTYGDGKFVAVGEQGVVAETVTGVDWAMRMSGYSGLLTNVAYLTGLWLATTDSGSILISADAVSWTIISTPISSRLRGIAFGLGRWFVTGAGGVILSSPDGENWSLVPSGVTFDLEAITFGHYLKHEPNPPPGVSIQGPDMFVAVGPGGRVLHSEDGETWTESNIGLDRDLYGTGIFHTRYISAVAGQQGHDYFYAIGSGGGLWYSSDALSWEPYHYNSPLGPPTPFPTETFLAATSTENSPENNLYAVGSDGRIFMDSIISNSSGQGLEHWENYEWATVPLDPAHLLNISSRGLVSSGEQALIAGFVIPGNEAVRILLRGVGPTLEDFGVSGFLADPVITLYDSVGAVISSNDDWWGYGNPGSAANGVAYKVGAFELRLLSKDAVILATLPPGSYTAVVTGKGGASGIALVEVYEY